MNKIEFFKNEHLFFSYGLNNVMTWKLFLGGGGGGGGVSGGYFRFSNFTNIWPILDFVRFYLVNLKM